MNNIIFKKHKDILDIKSYEGYFTFKNNLAKWWSGGCALTLR